MQRSNTANPPQAHASHTQAPDKEQARPGNRSPLRPALIGLAATLAALLVLTFGYSLSHDGRVFRGVSVLGTDLGGMSSAEARAALSQAAAGYPSDQIALQGSTRNWTFSPADLGVAVDVDKTLDSAMSIGRAEGFPGNIGAQLGTLLGGSRITPVLKSDNTLIEKAVASIAAEIDRPAVDSKLEQAPDGTVRITPSSRGTLLDREAMRSAFASAAASVPFAPVQIQMREDPPKVTEAALKSTEARALLLTGQPITLRAGKKSWTLEEARLREMLDLAPKPDGSYDAALGDSMLAAYLGTIGSQVKVDPTNARVVIGKGTVELKPDEDGAALDVPQAVTMVKKAAEGASAADRTIDLPIKPVIAEMRTDAVQAAYDKANSLVTEGIRLRFKEDGYILRGSSVTGFIDVAPTQGGPGLKVVVDEDVLATRISGVAYNINRPATDARFRMVGGSPAKVADAKEGLKVNVPKSLDNALKALEGYKGGDRLQVDLDVAVTQPTLAAADLASINTPDLLGTGQTSYAGSSAERAWNVGLGTRNIDGSLIPPGGTFSTVEAVGELTLKAGYKMGYAIVNTGKGVTTVPSEAGGICQVSTTLFHSVFWAGLPLVERNWHSYWISSYGVPPSGMLGLDATIAPPEKDFRFKNNTGGWILIKATADGTNVTFQLYGVNPGWKVAVNGPVIKNVVKTTQDPVTEYSSALPAGKKAFVERAQDGFNATITRVVRDGAGNVVDSWTGTSRYVPSRNRYLVGTGR